ncbi:hypothetical protein BaRGS_00001263 [Batillaria attramentaria]|uniref:Uncharacterized protein n=1 Tax=Batillaria attramentaria TaxID=370345 RepID=A0ABD0M764_9CAEN
MSGHHELGLTDRGGQTVRCIDEDSMVTQDWTLLFNTGSARQRSFLMGFHQILKVPFNDLLRQCCPACFTKDIENDLCFHREHKIGTTMDVKGVLSGDRFPLSSTLQFIPP